MADAPSGDAPVGEADADRMHQDEVEADDAEADADSSSSSVDAELLCTPLHMMVAYPFPADYQVSAGNAQMNVCQHLCRRHPEGTRAVVIFFPGVHGGVGPCRQPGSNFDEHALYPTLARSLAENQDVNCYRCSWTHMRPRMQDAVAGACQVLHNGLTEVMKAAPPDGQERDLKVLFFGHSLGGAVAVHSATVIANHFGLDGTGGQCMEGLERARVRMAGLCTLNGALAVEPDEDAERFSVLRESRALLVAGDADEVVEPSATEGLYGAMPMASKRHLVLPGGTHDLFAHKSQLLTELADFVAATVAG